MANITVISNDNFIHVDYGDYAISHGIKSPQVFNKRLIEGIRPLGEGVMITLGGDRNANHWYLSHESIPDQGSRKFLVIDSINSVAPSSKLDLISKLYNL